MATQQQQEKVQERLRQREFEDQPGEVKEAMEAVGSTLVTAPGGGGTEKGTAPEPAAGGSGGGAGKEGPMMGKGVENLPTTAAGSMGGGVAAPEVPIRMKDVLPEGEIESGDLDRPVTKMDAAAKQKEETAQFGGPVKGGTAARMQSAADKNVQAGLVPTLGAQLGEAKATEAGTGPGTGAGTEAGT